MKDKNNCLIQRSKNSVLILIYFLFVLNMKIDFVIVTAFENKDIKHDSLSKNLHTYLDYNY
jgi:hypothetical protein